MKDTRKFRLILGYLFIIVQFIPLGVYHFIGGPNIIGGLYNFIFPSGIISIVLGTALILYDRQALRTHIRLHHLMLLGGFLILLTTYNQHPDYFLGLWRGVNGDFDIEGVNTGYYVGIISLLTGMMIRRLKE